jgi:SM-20-related protein
VAALRTRLDERDTAAHLRPAGIGRGAKSLTRADIRGDRIDWLDPDAPHVSECGPWQMLEALRCACNATLQLGLFDCEAHYAAYPPGRGYARHIDRFRDDDARVLSFILYLNAGWTDDDGGALLLDTGRAEPMEIVPNGGTFVAFLSDRFPHEVAPARRLRRSLAGWFRRRA